MRAAITSRHHPFLARCRRLAAGRGADDEVLLDGEHLIGDALGAGVPLVGLLSDGRHDALVREGEAAGAVCYLGSPALVQAASPVRSASGVVAVGRWRPKNADALLGIGAVGPILSLLDVQDPGNVGGMIRTADALGARAVLALGATADPAGWKALRSAMGSTFRVPVGVGGADAVLNTAKRIGLPVVALVPRGGVTLGDWTLPPACLVLVGNEGAGLAPSFETNADVRVTIPMRPGPESLNVGVGAALVLWEWWRRQMGERP